jgi:hypothetical protein
VEFSDYSTEALLFAVELRPDGEHDVAEEERVERNERNVAAEVEGEDDTIRRMSPHPC